jgi:hypothetical protein
MIAAALSLTGCGGGGMQGGTDSKADPIAMGRAVRAAELQAKANGTTVSPKDLVFCTDEEWEDLFWSDATHTVLVGTMSCDQCFGVLTTTGVTSDFITLAFEEKCSNE